mgnify:CR=1 FL=1
METHHTRRYDIDWIRTLALAVLILYHIGMYYVADWGWHIKSANTSEFLQNIMILTNPWRMSLLFFIAAIALAFVQQKYATWHLFKTRTSRLLNPLLFGMFIIVVPQTYYEALSQNLIEPSFFQFWKEYINPNTQLLKDHHTVIGLLTWNHLWFLPYLWLYSLIFLFAKLPMTKLAESSIAKTTPMPVIFVLMAILLVVVWYFLRPDFPPTNALVNDWFNHGKYFSVFAFGYVFALQKNWWSFVIEKRNYFLTLALCGYVFLIADRNGLFTTLASQYDTNVFVKLLYGFIMSINHWAWIMAVVGLAGYWLNRPSEKLKYATAAILPWYVLHQTLIIVFAWWLKPLDMPIFLESVLLLFMTLAGCFLGYEVIRRVNFLRYWCGIPPNTKPSNVIQVAKRAATNN